MTRLINLMEETVLRKIDQLWPGTNYCKCEQCRLDIATYALNRLPAQYVQSLKGKVLYRFESTSMQRDIEVTVAVGQGIEIVGKSPHKNGNANIDEAADGNAASDNAAGGNAASDNAADGNAASDNAAGGNAASDNAAGGNAVTESAV